MGLLSLTLPTIGQPVSTEDVKIVNALSAIQTVLNGNIDTSNAPSAFLRLNTPGATKIAFGSFVPGTGMGGANRATYTIPHGLGSTPSNWGVTGGFIQGASTSTGQNESIAASRQAEDATNLTVLCVLTNGATAAVGPTRLNWWAIV